MSLVHTAVNLFACFCGDFRNEKAKGRSRGWNVLAWMGRLRGLGLRGERGSLETYLVLFFRPLSSDHDSEQPQWLLPSRFSKLPGWA